ncbi:MAG: CBS domain-containing protein [Acidimicrobiia bacterium]
MNIADSLAAMPVTDVDLSRYVAVVRDATVATTVGKMRAAHRACACVVDSGRVVGVFTQRDVLHRVIGRPGTWDRPITEEMTIRVRTMRSTDSVWQGLAIMSDWWVRNVPVTDEETLVGNLSFYVVMTAMADLLSARLGAADEPELQHGLSFVDFTGLPTNPPVTVTTDETADVAAHHMRARGIGSVLVVDSRESLVGVLTEYDLLEKIGCDRSDLDQIEVGEIMTPDPVALRVRSPIAGAIAEIAAHGFSHVPLLGETDRPVAVTSFRDIAQYVESSLEALG